MIDVRNISIEFPFFFSFSGFLNWKFAMTEKADNRAKIFFAVWTLTQSLESAKSLCCPCLAVDRTSQHGGQNA